MYDIYVDEHFFLYVVYQTSIKILNSHRKPEGKVNPIIIQIIHIDLVVLLVLRLAIAKPTHGIVIVVGVFKVFPAWVRKHLHGMQRGTFQSQ